MDVVMDYGMVVDVLLSSIRCTTAKLILILIGWAGRHRDALSIDGMSPKLLHAFLL